MKIGKKKQEQEGGSPIILTSLPGQEGWSFPSGVIETLRGLVTRISKEGSFPSRLSLVAAQSGEGVTFISRALATILAHDFSPKVCLVDLNWWRPSSILFSVPENPGVAGVLRGEAKVNDALIPTGLTNLVIVPSGKIAKHDRSVWSRSQGLKMLIDDLGSRFDTLILDIPAILQTNDAVPLASLGTACCLVIRQGATRSYDVQQALDEIDHLRVLGVVLNCVRIATPLELVKLLSL